MRLRRAPVILDKAVDELLFSEASVPRRVGEVFRLKQLWLAAGSKISRISSPYRLTNGILYVAVHDPIWIAELPYIKGEIISKLKEAGLNLDDIKFTPSKIYKKPAPEIEPLKPVDESYRNWAYKTSSLIKDESVREAFLKALTAYLGRN